MKTKKILAVVLALALAMGLSTAVLADNTHTEPGTETIGVNGSYGGDSTAADVYSVDVKWGAMTFTYTTTGEKTWNPATHTYSPSDTDKWEAEGDTVTVTNHSNVAVDIEFNFVKDENSYKGEYTGAMSETSKRLDAGVENKPDEAASVTSTLTLSGQLNRVVDSVTKLGDINVVIKAVA